MISENIFKTEIFFPALFSDFEQRKWGGFFYNGQNPCSYDSNSAVVWACDLTDEISAEIDAYYNEKNLTPRFRHVNKNYFSEEKKKCPDFRLMIHQNEVNIKSNNRLNIKIIEHYDEKITENILLGSQKEYFEKVLIKSLKNPDYKLAVGYLFDEPVSMAGMWFSPYETVRIDSVQTGIWCRSCGFASEVMKYTVEYIKSKTNHPIYLITDNPTAVKIYKQAGFAEIL